MKSLCIVGNGIITHPQGHIINTIDTVVRLSSYKTIGFEHLVGNKTDIVAVARIENVPKGVKVWIANPYGLSATPQEIIDRVYNQGYLINPEDCIKRTYKLCGYKEGGSHPTLGMLTIMMAYTMGRFFYDKIYVTGFDFNHVGKQKYYWTQDKIKKLAPESVHNYSNERRVLKKLIADGLVEYLDMSDIYLLEDVLI